MESGWLLRAALGLQRAPPPLRDRSHIWGLPGLSIDKVSKVECGNATALASSSIIKAGLQRGLPCFLENPDASMLFACPAILHLLQRAHTTRVSMCAFGTPWRKHTKIVAWNAPDFACPHCLCRSRSSVCSFVM